MTFLTVGFGIVVTYNDVTYSKTTAGQILKNCLLGMLWCNVGNTKVILYFGLECGRIDNKHIFAESKLRATAWLHGQLLTWL